jgi:cell wall-associated NlpC family hydrolase
MRPDALALARQFVGVPFKHQGRNPAVGVDCVGLGVLYLRALGLDVHDRTDYGRDPDGTLRRELTRVLGAPVAEGPGCWRQARPGDVLSVRFARLGHVPERHVAIASELYGQPAIIHAESSATVGKVCEHPLNATWQRRVIGVWRLA